MFIDKKTFYKHRLFLTELMFEGTEEIPGAGRGGQETDDDSDDGASTGED